MPNNEILRLIADNPALLQAVKDVLLKQFQIPERLSSLNGTTNQELGEALRSYILGHSALEDAFKEISKYKTPEPRGERINPGI